MYEFDVDVAAVFLFKERIALVLAAGSLNRICVAVREAGHQPNIGAGPPTHKHTLAAYDTYNTHIYITYYYIVCYVPPSSPPSAYITWRPMDNVAVYWRPMRDSIDRQANVCLAAYVNVRNCAHSKKIQRTQITFLHCPPTRQVMGYYQRRLSRWRVGTTSTCPLSQNRGVKPVC